MKKIAIYGAGHLGIQFYNHLKNMDIEIVGFFDDTKTLGINDEVPAPIIGNRKSIKEMYERGLFNFILLAIGYNHMNLRDQLFWELKGYGVKFFTFIHHTCYLDKTTVVGEGAFIYPGCILDFNVKIGSNVLLNNGCIISHDSIIGNSSYLAPGVNISGFSNIGSCNFIGTGANLIDNIKTNDNITIGAGALVLKNLTDAGVYVGCPVKRIKKK